MIFDHIVYAPYDHELSQTTRIRLKLKINRHYVKVQILKNDTLTLNSFYT